MGLIMVIGIVAKNGILLLDADEKFRAEGAIRTRRHDARGAAPAAADRDDGAGGGLRHASAGLCHRRRIADAAAAGYCGHRRTVISMVLSLVITPLVYYLLTRNRVGVTERRNSIEGYSGRSLRLTDRPATR